MRSTIFIASILTIVSGCKKRADSSDLRITNGSQVENRHKYPAVVRIATTIRDNKTNQFTGEFIWCTGVWVSDQVVLTAERCVTHPQFGKLQIVTITAGSGNGTESRKIIFQSDIGPAITPGTQAIANTPQVPLGLAAIIFERNQLSSFHVPVAETIAQLNSEPAKLIGYPKARVTQETISSGSIEKYEGTNTPIYGSPFLEIEAADDAKGPGTSLAVDADMGGPLLQDKFLEGIAVDYQARPTGAMHFNRYVNLAEGPGHEFLLKIRDQNQVMIRNLDGQDHLKGVKGADLEYKPYENDLRDQSRQAAGIQTGTASNSTSAAPTIVSSVCNGEANSNPAIGFKTHSLSEALTKAKTTCQRVIVLFSATWCGPCQQVHNSLLPSVDYLFKNEIFVDLDVDRDPASTRLYGVSGIPEFIIMNAKGEIKRDRTNPDQLMRQVGYQPPASFANWLTRVPTK